MAIFNKKINSFQIILLGFIAVVLIGSLLLMLPVSSSTGQVTHFKDASFTAVSAVCVTGLVVKDTATYWSEFGQFIILILIQIGGLGVVSVAAIFAMLTGKNINLKTRSLMQDAISAPKVGGIVRITRFIVILTICFEAIGALVMMPTFCGEYGSKGVWMSIFHSISAFCNAGFDIMGSEKVKFVSLTQYADNPVINITIMVLIVVGGIGFLVLHDIKDNKLHFSRYRLHTKIVLVTTAILILVPAIIFFFKQYGDLPMGKRTLASLFQAITPRTAGFNTMDMTKLNDGNKMITTMLMLVGGSPGSTAGGMKTVTIAILLVNAISVLKRRGEAEIFKRRIEGSALRTASAIFFYYIGLFTLCSVAISALDKLPIAKCMFETASALGTVGLSLGITPGLSVASRTILMILMFLGRVGGLTIIFAAISKSGDVSKLPKEDVIVG